ncbi:MAG: NAD(P)/FAD-dependent oxidoreductase [Pseudomonadota bacterium]
MPATAASLTSYDVIVLGAGAAGLFCAGEAARRGRTVLALDHATKIGEKIRISGGGRCNFTNIHTSPANFLSENPKFCVSALSGFTPQGFIDRIDAADIAWHEKKLGQLFCDGSANQIVTMLTDGLAANGAGLRTGVSIEAVRRDESGFVVETDEGRYRAASLVVATGGKSIPKIGATGAGYKIAADFGLPVIEPRPALVPLTFAGADKEMASALAGVSIDASVTTEALKPTPKGARKSAKPPSFRDGFLFTHRGLSGPSILQISSYWREGAALSVDLAPTCDVFTELRTKRSDNGRMGLAAALSDTMPKRLAATIADHENWRGNLADRSDKALTAIAKRVHGWRVTPVGTEGYRTAEVTAGGVDTRTLNSKTMEAKSVPGLYFIGEVVDVTGWLGGYNFQWAWASAYAAAQAV